MPCRLLPLLVSVALVAGCTNNGPDAGAARAVVQWDNFDPGCLRVTVRDAEGASDPVATELTADGAERSGQKVIAVFRKPEWSSRVFVVAEAFEGACGEGKVVAREEKTASVASGVTELQFQLTASDVDEDGFVDAKSPLPGSDCNDASAASFPGGTEICDTDDNDCDGEIDEGVATTFFRDQDQDTFGDALTTQQACAAPQGFVENSQDCDDARAEVNPTGTESCNGLDDNCSGETDEGFAQTPWYRDVDGDTYGNAQQVTMACAQPENHVAVAGDCNDSAVDINPDSVEVCNGLDDNCNNVTDENVTLPFFADVDQDGFGDTNTSVMACEAPMGHVAQGGDCDDGDAMRKPGLAETCDGKDNNCAGGVDEGVTVALYQDGDSDGFGDPAVSQQGCAANPPMGFVLNSDDCDDGNGSIKPGVTELCDGVDNNCAGGIDEGVTVAFFHDVDGDTFGDPSDTQQACPGMPPMGYVAAAGDCDDGDSDVFPGNTEVCDEKDNNCAGGVDEGVLMTFSLDEDLDGFGHPTQTVQACTVGPGRASNSTDCDDGNPYRSPGLTELCDELDNDCANGVDDGMVCTTHSWKTLTGSVAGGSHDWARVSAYAGGAWVAGQDISNGNAKLHTVSDANTNVGDFDGDCSGDAWSALWANPVSGRGYLGGDTGLVAWHDPGASDSCGATATAPSNGSRIRGVRGMLDGGNFFLYGTSTSGRIFKWDPTSSSPPAHIASVTGTFWAFDGISPTLAYAVGSINSSAAVIRATSATTWATDTLPSGLPAGELRALSVAPNGFAAAVGDNALLIVRDPKGTAWQALPSSPPNAANLRGVLTFGRNLIYVVGTTNSASAAWRWDGTAWTTLSGVNLTSTPQDIDGLSPSNLWIAGNDGLVRHFSP